MQDLLAGRVAKAEAVARPAVAAPEAANGSLAPALVAPNGASEDESRAEQAADPSPAPALTAAPVPVRYPLHALLGSAEQEDLEYLKCLLGHAVPSGEITAVPGRVFQAAIRELERRKFALTSRSRKPSGKASANARHIPAHVRREVFVRDEGGCTSVSAKGRRCGSSRRLEFDHFQPVARGGRSTTANLRLRCQTHNQPAAEQALGAGSMERKRAEARKQSEARRRAASAATAEQARKEAYARELAANEVARARAEEIMPWLRTLGFRDAEARRAAVASGEALPDASLEERVKHALRHLAPPGARKVLPAASSPA